MWTYDELVATAYVFYRGNLNTLTIARLLRELNIKDKKMNKLINKFSVDETCHSKLVEGATLKDLVEFINPEIFSYLIANSDFSLGEFLYDILAIEDTETKNMLLDKYTKLIDFNNINLDSEVKKKVKR